VPVLRITQSRSDESDECGRSGLCSSPRGLRDTTVPAPLAFELIADLWTGGANAQFRTYPTGHSETMFASLPDTTGFVAELLRP